MARYYITSYTSPTFSSLVDKDSRDGHVGRSVRNNLFLRSVFLTFKKNRAKRKTSQISSQGGSFVESPISLLSLSDALLKGLRQVKRLSGGHGHFISSSAHATCPTYIEFSS